MEWNQSNLENLAHIAYAAGLNGYYSGNFIEDRATFISWGEEFYERYKAQEDNGWDEYEQEWIEAIDAFIDEKLNAPDDAVSSAPADMDIIDVLSLARERLEINNADNMESEAIEALNKAIMQIRKQREQKHYEQHPKH